MATKHLSQRAGITNIDPLYFEIPFERCLNPERPSAPDVDMDYADNRRDEIITYAREKYGEDKVGQMLSSSVGSNYMSTDSKAFDELVTAVRTVKQFLTFVNGAPFQPAVAQPFLQSVDVGAGGEGADRVAMGAALEEAVAAAWARPPRAPPERRGRGCRAPRAD